MNWKLEALALAIGWTGITSLIAFLAMIFGNLSFEHAIILVLIAYTVVAVGVGFLMLLTRTIEWIDSRPHK